MMKTKKVDRDIYTNTHVAIKIEHLFCVYNEGNENQLVSLCDNNLELEKNKIHFIIGSSGCGKSTLVNHFNGLLKSRYGNVLVDNNHKIGNDFFLNDYLIGVLKKNQNDFENFFHKQHLYSNQFGYYAAFRQKLPKSLIKIIFEAYYKIKIKKVITLVPKHKTNVKYYFLIPNIDEYKIDVLDCINLGDIQDDQISSNDNWVMLLWKKYRKIKKIKKIKNLKKTVGIVFQFPEYQLFKDTVLKDVMFGPVTLGVDKQEAKTKSIDYLNELGINNSFLDRSPFDMSGGQKRRVAIAGILAFDPNVLVFDEPTAGLDPFGEQEILKIIQKAKDDGKTVIVISHNMDHVLQKADNVIVMNDGEIIQIGSPYEIFTNDKILALTSIDKPKIISIIQGLIKKNYKFNKLWNYQPRTVEELSLAITKIAKSENII